MENMILSLLILKAMTIYEMRSRISPRFAVTALEACRPL